MSNSQVLSVFGFLLIATTLEVSGDAIVRLAIYNHAGLLRFALMFIGAVVGQLSPASIEPKVSPQGRSF